MSPAIKPFDFTDDRDHDPDPGIFKGILVDIISAVQSSHLISMQHIGL